MNSEKQRVINFMLITFASIMAINLALKSAGLLPDEVEPAPAPGQVAAKDAGKAKADEKAVAKIEPAAKVGPDEPATVKAKPSATASAAVVKPADPQELRIGSTQPGRKMTRKDPSDYRLEVSFEQKGAAVLSVASALYEAEYERGKPTDRPLPIVRYDPLAVPSLALAIRPPASLAPKVTTGDEEPGDAKKLIEAASREAEVPLDREVWEVVRNDQGRAVRPISRIDETTKAAVDGQEIAFRTTVDELSLTVTKTFRLFKGKDAFEVDLKFEGGEKTPRFGYRLMGPHGIPIEGEWYTGTFRDAVFGLADGPTTTVKTLSAYDIAKAGPNVERFETMPLRFAGVENQYFTTFILPYPIPKGESDRHDAETLPVVLHDEPDNRQKADIGVEVLSRPIAPGLNAPVVHGYRVFAGPKTREALEPYGAEELAAYRKSNFIPFATFLAKTLITPLLGWTYQATVVVSRAFGGTRGNYGVAIILLTLLVRLLMFPLGRKAAMAAKKMQDLQPELKKIQEKYKDDKEAVTRETFALYRKQGVNPVGGCLPALVQLPIFVGLWQALNNSVYLRHADFLYIDNLAAPDMLFRLPFDIPYIGQYFNLLPFLVVALMLVQTKLFSPPATTPEAEMQQKMMKYMMVFMAFMFYKVPSGLGIYFITSSLWQIGERLLLPKVTASKPGTGVEAPTDGSASASGPKAPEKPPGLYAKLMDRMHDLLDEAKKDATHRKDADGGPASSAVRDRDRPADRDRGRDRDRNNDRDRDRDRGKRRERPGKPR